MARELTVEDFTPRLGEAFAVRAEGADGLELVLAEARALGDSFGEREAFALLFRGPADPVMPQATYRLAHVGLGDLEIFIVPVGRTSEATDYEAIFT